MRRFLCILISLITVLSGGINAVADRNEDRVNNSQQDSVVSEEKSIPEFADNIKEKLSGYIILKTGSNIVFENGLGKEIDVEPYYKNENVFIPAAVCAEFFGKEAVYDKETGNVSIDDEIIHPSDVSEIVSDRTMIVPDKLAQYLECDVVFNNNEIVILGKNDLEDDVVDEIVKTLRDKFYVVNDTTVTGDGSFENPFGGLEAAVAGIRQITQSGMTSDITVYLRGGMYYLENSLTFTPEDSGKNGYTITYKSYPGEQAEITASHEITNWREYTNGIYVASVDPATEINALFENDSYAVKARYPNIGDGEFRDYYLTSDGYNTNNQAQFYFAQGDIPYLNDTTGLQTAFFGGGEEGIFNWVFEIANSQIDYREHTITLSRVPRYVMGKGSRYYLQGCLEFLDTEGEFWYDAVNKQIYYKPYNDDIENQTISYGTVISPIAVTGTENNPVENLIFEDLKIGKSNSATESNEGIPMSNQFINARNCKIINSEILMTGGTAIGIRDCNNIEISGNYIHDVGGTGVEISDNNANGVIKYGGNLVTNNYIYNVGNIVRHSSGISVGNSDRNTITYNRIDKSTRFGINYGTGFIAKSRIGQTINGVLVDELNQFDFMNAKENHIAFNDISNCMEDTQDGGPIYTWEAGKDNLIENNHIHDSNIHFSIGYGIYNDDQSSYETYSKNIIDNLQHEGNGQLSAAIITKGVANKLINNFMIDTNPQLGAYSTETKLNDPHDRMEYIRNITFRSGDQLHGQWLWYDDRFKVCNYNLYFTESGEYKIYNNYKAATYDEWKKIYTDYGYMDTNSIAGEDPNFVDADNRDFRLRYDSPAYKLGIEDIDEKNIGLEEDFKFADPEEEINKIYLETDTDGLSANVRLKSGQSTNISVSARTLRGFYANLDNANITYASDNEDVATVDANGVVRANNSGIATITVTVDKNGQSVSSVLYILVNDELESVSADVVSDVLDIGTETEVVTVANSSMGYAVPVNEFTYTSSNTNVLTVDSEGKITAVGAGNAVVTVSASFKGVTKSAQTSVKVVDGVIDVITLSAEKTDAILIGEEVQLNGEATLSNGNKANMDEVTVTYESADDSIVSVDENGIMTGMGEGRTVITVYMEKDGYRKSTQINVSAFNEYSGTLAEGFEEINFGNSHGYADFREDGTIFMRATGQDFFGKADDGYWLYKKMQGDEDMSIEATLESVYNTSTNATVGISIRETDTPESKHVTIRMTTGGGLLVVWRSETGGDCGYQGINSNGFPAKVKLEKDGNTVIAYLDTGDGFEEVYRMDMQFDGYSAGVSLFAQSDISTEAVVSGLVINE